MTLLNQELIAARNEADLAADAQLAVWDHLPSLPSHSEILEWVEARDNFQAAQAKYLMIIWKSQDI